MSETLYHYCSLDTFLKIISNKTIRVSDISKTNDYEEILWISKYIPEVTKHCIEDNLKFRSMYNIDDTKLSMLLETVNKVIDAFFRKNTKTLITYICCFSEESDLLSQWRGYANDGNGIAIGFNKNLLMSFGLKYYYNFKKVEYIPIRQTKYVTDMINMIINAYCVDDIDRNIDDLFSEFSEDLYGMIRTIRINAPLFKNAAFSEEKEWRLYSNTHLANYSETNFEEENSDGDICSVDEDFSKVSKLRNGFVRYPTSFWARGNKIVPYFDLGFNKIKDQLINEIIIGPKCDVSEKDIKFVLQVNGYDDDSVIIKPSNCTYR